MGARASLAFRLTRRGRRRRSLGRHLNPAGHLQMLASDFRLQGPSFLGDLLRFVETPLENLA